MSNEISGINSSRAQQSGNRNAQRVSGDDAKTKSAHSATQANNADKVSLTSTAARLKDIERGLADQSPVDTDRVNEMKAALANGDFKVNAESVADKMIAFESALDV